MPIVGMGIDLVKVPRISYLTNKWRGRFLKRIFTQKELDYAFQRKRPYEHLAARFAAKEAFIKAIRKKVGWKKIEVARQPPKAPYFSRFPPSFNDLNNRIHLSLAHTKTNAIAFVVIEKVI